MLRRRRTLRWIVAMVAIVLVVLGWSGFVYWKNTRFPARSERLAGTPVELRIQDGVSGRELRAIRRGLHAADRFARRSLGWTVRGQVETRIAHGNGCHPFQSAGGSLVGEGKKGFVCIDTAAPSWQWLVRKDLTDAAAVPAHEYVHVVQGDIGCLPPPNDQHFHWILEGMASEVGWQALVAAGRATKTRVARTIIRDGAFDSNLEALPRYERDDGRDSEYALWHLAIRRLLQNAVTAGAAPRGRREIALRHFCARVAHGRPWRSAFARSFGLSVQRFYARFERARQRGTLMSRHQRRLYARWLW